MKLLSRPDQLVEHMVPEHLRVAGDEDAVRRARLLCWFSVVLLCAGCLWIVLNCAFGLFRAASHIAVALLVLGFVPVSLRRSIVLATYHLAGTLLAVVLAIAWFRGKQEAPLMVWLVLCPLIATMLAGPKTGYAWLATVAVAILVMMSYGRVEAAQSPISKIWILRPLTLITAASCTQFCAVAYERMRHRMMARLRQMNEELERRHAQVRQQLEQIEVLHGELATEHRVAHAAVSKIVERREFSLFNSSFLRRIVIPSAQFSGDVVLASYTRADSLRVMLADFTGHGLTAAIGTIPAATIFYEATAAGVELEELVLQLNERLSALLPTGLFCATCIMELNVAGELALWNGGMPAVLLVRDGEIIRRFSAQSVPVAVLPSLSGLSELQRATLTEGDRLIAFSDGVPETADEQGTLLGIDNTERLLCAGLYDLGVALEQFRGRAAQRDDVSALEVTFGAAFIAACGESMTEQPQRSARAEPRRVAS